MNYINTTDMPGLVRRKERIEKNCMKDSKRIKCLKTIAVEIERLITEFNGSCTFLVSQYGSTLLAVKRAEDALLYTAKAGREVKDRIKVLEDLEENPITFKAEV